MMQGNGVTGIIELILDEEEKKLFKHSSDSIKKVTDSIKL